VKFFVDILLITILLTAFLTACWLGVRVGNYRPVLFLLFVVVLYFFLTWPFQKNSSIDFIQRYVINVLTALAIMLVGLMLIWLGISEFSAPIDFSRRRFDLVNNLIRNTVGSIGVSVLMWFFGGALIFVAIGRLRVSKLRSRNSLFKRDVQRGS